MADQAGRGCFDRLWDLNMLAYVWLASAFSRVEELKRPSYVFRSILFLDVKVPCWQERDVAVVQWNIVSI
jgi:hypothetical protein